MLIFLRVLQAGILYGASAHLFYSSFDGQLRFSPTKTAAILISFFTVALAAYAVLMQISYPISLAWFIVCIPIFCTFFLCTVQERIQKTIAVLLLVICYGSFICGCSVFISNLIFDKGLGNSALYTIATLFLGASTYPLAYRFLIESVISPLEQVENGGVMSVYFMPLFYIITQVVFFVLYDAMDQMNDIVYFVVLIAINVSAYSLTMDSVRLMGGMADNLRMQEELNTAEKLLELQKSQYASWVTQIEEVRRARHDLKHHIAIVQAFLDNDDKEGLKSHVRAFQQTLPETAPMQICKHMAVNAILLHYYDRAKREGVHISLIAEIEEDITINSQDLSVIIGNCLENAFESCARMDSKSERTVSLMAKPMGSGLAIVIDNTFDGQTVREKDVYLSSKRALGHRGVGMDSVKLLVKKYGGIVSFETSENIFMTSIRLGGRIAKAEVSTVVQ